jgi:hypothetical protein
MSGKEIEPEAVVSEIKGISASLPVKAPAIQVEAEKLLKDTTTEIVPAVKDLKKKKEKAPKVPGKSPLNFLFDPKKKTVLGRDGLQWGS